MQLKIIGVFVVIAALMADVTLFGSSAEAADIKGPMLANTCAGCHGTNGVSGGPAMPTIAGMPAQYLIDLMEGYKSGERPSTIMGRLAKGYTAEEIALIAEFFAKQKWENAESAPQFKQATAVVDEKLARQGRKLVDEAKCERCHEDAGAVQGDDIPRMAGQWLDYLLIKMQDYKNPSLIIPQPFKMEVGIESLSAKELEAVAHFYASQK